MQHLPIIVIHKLITDSLLSVFLNNSKFKSLDNRSYMHVAGLLGLKLPVGQKVQTANSVWKAGGTFFPTGDNDYDSATGLDNRAVRKVPYQLSTIRIFTSVVKTITRPNQYHQPCLVLCCWDCTANRKPRKLNLLAAKLGKLVQLNTDVQSAHDAYLLLRVSSGGNERVSDLRNKMKERLQRVLY